MISQKTFNASHLPRRLIIQIPCWNESEQIASCLQTLPKTLPGFSSVETLVIDDGSADDTIKMAKAAGVDHILALGRHKGLAQGFYEGMKYAFTTLDADILVNFDADLQYLATDIPKLLEPLMNGEADYVLGERQFSLISHWGQTKMALQRLGSLFVSILCKQRIHDVTTGFRALNREAGLRLSVLSNYTYTIETLVHAVHCDVSVRCVPVQTRLTPTRPSRLIRNAFLYCLRAVKTASITLLRHRAFEFFLVLFYLATGGFIGSLALYCLSPNLPGPGHLHGRAFALCVGFGILAMDFLIAAIISDNIYTNRQMTEEMRYELRRRDIERRSTMSDAKTDLTNV